MENVKSAFNIIAHMFFYREPVLLFEGFQPKGKKRVRLPKAKSAITIQI